MLSGGEQQRVAIANGNLLENACKWAASHEAVLRRGVRADEAAPGSGLGLAIVRLPRA